MIGSIQPRVPTFTAARTLAAASQPSSTPADTVTRSGDEKPAPSMAKVALYTAVGAGAGIYAGAATGVLAGVAGAGSLAPALSILGAVGVGVLAEKLGTSGSATAGAALWGGLGGLVLGVAGGAYLGATAASPVAAVALGVAGALGGAVHGLTR